jgi:serralysin
MLKFVISFTCGIVFSFASVSITQAAFHLWDVNELYSNADGTIQFIEMHVPSSEPFNNNEHFVNGTMFSSTNGPTTNTFVLDHNLDTSIPTSERYFLAGTSGFAAAPGAVTPDFILPNGFLFPFGGGLLTFQDAQTATLDSALYASLPLGIMSWNRDGSNGINSPTNFAGQAGSIVPLPAAGWLLLSGLAVLMARGTRRRG